jgi:ADP-dependent phosphofructokinase/glucokinase
LANSQKLSAQDSSCTVPCYTLRNALVVKADCDYLKDQIEITRDSIKILDSILENQNAIVILQNEALSLQKQNEKTLIEIIENKNKEITIHKKEIKKQKIHKKLAYIISIASIAFGVYTIL